MTTKAIELIEFSLAIDCDAVDQLFKMPCTGIGCKNCMFNSLIHEEIQDILIQVIEDAKDQSS